MKEFDMAFFIAATATIYVSHIRVRGTSTRTELIYHMPVARGGIRGFHFSPSHTHTHTYTSFRKIIFENIYYKCIPLCSFFASDLVLRYLKVLNF